MKGQRLWQNSWIGYVYAISAGLIVVAFRIGIASALLLSKTSGARYLRISPTMLILRLCRNCAWQSNRRCSAIRSFR